MSPAAWLLPGGMYWAWLEGRFSGRFWRPVASGRAASGASRSFGARPAHACARASSPALHMRVCLCPRAPATCVCWRTRVCVCGHAAGGCSPGAGTAAHACARARRPRGNNCAVPARVPAGAARSHTCARRPCVPPARVCLHTCVLTYMCTPAPRSPAPLPFLRRFLGGFGPLPPSPIAPASGARQDPAVAAAARITARGAARIAARIAAHIAAQIAAAPAAGPRGCAGSRRRSACRRWRHRLPSPIAAAPCGSSSAGPCTSPPL